MAELILHPTSTAQWQAIVHEAECIASRHLKEDLQSYLVFMLMRFTRKPRLFEHIVSTEYLESLDLRGPAKHKQLREVGDHCLLFSGLFPQQASRRMVRLSYFVNMGRTAYDLASQHTPSKSSEVFADLAREFIDLMDVLQAMREMGRESPGLSPLEAFELWQETGSEQAKKILSQHSNGVAHNSRDKNKNSLH